MKVPEARSKKPMISCQINVSHPIKSDITQIKSVLEVSMVDLWAAVANLVIATPVALKEAIDTIMKQD